MIGLSLLLALQAASGTPIGARRDDLPSVFVKFAPAALRKVGTQKVGLLCFPGPPVRGSLFLRALQLEADHAFRMTMREAARANRRLYDWSDEVDDIEADVRALKVKGCARRWGLGDKYSITGRAWMTVVWTAHFVDANRPPLRIEATTALEWPESAGENVDLVTATFADNVRSFVSDVSRGLPSP